jgi:hypothetical protein
MVFEKIPPAEHGRRLRPVRRRGPVRGLERDRRTQFLERDLVLNVTRMVMYMSFAMPWQNQMTANDAVDFYKSVFKAIRDYQDKANEYYAEKALSIAKKVKKANLDDRGIKACPSIPSIPSRRSRTPENSWNTRTTRRRSPMPPWPPSANSHFASSIRT